MAAYDAVKLPLVLVLTSSFTVLFGWVAALALSRPLRFAQVAVLTFQPGAPVIQDRAYTTKDGRVTAADYNPQPKEQPHGTKEGV